MRTLLGYHLITAADWNALHDENVKQQMRIDDLLIERNYIQLAYNSLQNINAAQSAEIDHLTAQVAASGMASDAALDNAYGQINALSAENARLLQDLAARDTTIAALSAKSARTARKKPVEPSS